MLLKPKKITQRQKRLNLLFQLIRINPYSNAIFVHFIIFQSHVMAFHIVIPQVLNHVVAGGA